MFTILRLISSYTPSPPSVFITNLHT